MSRTVHHVPWRHRTLTAYWPQGLAGPWTAHSLVELRYSEAELRRAQRAGRRPAPALLTRTFASYTFPRAMNERFRDPYESRARAKLRAFRTAARKHLRAAPAGALRTAAEDLDHPPTRHRHRNIWEC
ncbi:hypothetical protein [Streptomyces cavernae]|uniref:hypothetical protein n=1 Tax=Streptomyces cavernae TaxID=2259034 RepID=UPI000FEB7132|nr:hypothetical protein [Streptomyces cavernae]